MRLHGCYETPRGGIPEQEYTTAGGDEEDGTTTGGRSTVCAANMKKYCYAISLTHLRKMFVYVYIILLVYTDRSTSNTGN